MLVFNRHRIILSAAAIAGCSALGFVGTASAACQTGAAHYDIAAGRLDTALQDFGHISGCPVDVNTSLLGNDKAKALKGDYTPSAALIRLVRGSGLEVHVNDGQYAVNKDDQKAMHQQIDQLHTLVVDAEKSGQISKKTAAHMKRKLKSAGNHIDAYIKSQGFLSAAEKASYEQMFANMHGQLAGQAAAHASNSMSAGKPAADQQDTTAQKNGSADGETDNSASQ